MAETIAVTHLETRKRAEGTTRLCRHEQPAEAAPGEALLQVRRFGLSTNNITYAAFGAVPGLEYWSFYPTGHADWGHMPVWGFADVVASGVDGIAVGERFYGYLPIASHVRMQPVRVTARGFYDGAPHRQKLVSAYNQYTRCGTDPGYARDRENLQMLLRPLFITSWMLADYLEDNGFFGAQQLLFSSASSKTAYGTAWCLAGSEQPRRIALTGLRNQHFTETLRCYQEVLSYPDLGQVRADIPTAYVDFSGQAELRASVRKHFGTALIHDCFAGSAQTTAAPAFAASGGAPPVLFFAPEQIKKRTADWGPAEFNRRYAEAERRFGDEATRGDPPALRVVESRGFEGAQTVIGDLHGGRSDARDGHVVVLE